MTIKSDRWIKQMAQEHGMIEPFAEKQMREGVVSYGLSSYGYDIRVADEFKIFTNVNTTIVDPKHFDSRSFVDVRGDVCIIPPNSFALAKTVEYFRIPRDVLTICVGKCLTGDTRVIDAETGAYRPIQEFVQQSAQRTLSLNGWRLRSTPVTAWIENGCQPVYRLRTWSGLEVKATLTHPFRTWTGWTPLANLAPGDRIAVARSCPVWGSDDWPHHEAVLLGLMLADGQCNTPGHSPRYTTSDPCLAQFLTQAAHEFGCDVSSAGKYGYNIVNRRGRGGIAQKNRLAAWLERLECNKHSADKFVPTCVFTARKEVVITFLQALFSGDGSAYTSGDGVRVEYYSISKRLIEDVRHLLLRFGIFAVVRSKRVWTGDVAYSLSITDRFMIQRFAAEIGFLPGTQKQYALQALLKIITTTPRCKSNFDTLPPAAWAVMRDVVHASGHSLRSVGVMGTTTKQSLPYAVATKAAQAVQNDAFSELVTSDVVWDRVVSIEYAGIEPVYDITVPETHNFVANDVVVHNSTYARCGLIVNVTPFEPEWEGFVTLEISNTTPLPAKIYANEGIAQVLFFQSDEPCETSYADKRGKYQNQPGLVLPKL